MDFKRLIDILSYQLARFPKETAIAYKEEGRWRHYSTATCLREIDQLSAGLLDSKLVSGDKIGIMTKMGSPAWNFLDLAAQQIGLIVVPIHATVSQNELLYILNDAGIKQLFVGDEVLYAMAERAKAQAPELTGIFTIKQHGNLPHWTVLSMVPTDHHRQLLEERRAAVKEEDLATIIYTSGTTGRPKGVMLSHRNVVSNIKSTIPLIPIDLEKRAISFLPLSHIFERMVTYTYMAVGASIYYLDDSESILDNIREVRPHYFTSVPRLLEKVHEGLLRVVRKGGPVKRRIVSWAIALGENYREGQRFNVRYRLKRSLASLLVYRHWRNLLGGHIEGVVVGAAALQPRLGRLFSAAGINIREGYGLTETSPVIAFNRFEPGGVRFGTVGIPVPGVELRIEDPDQEGMGEILVRGPNVMLGYYNQPEETAAVLDAEGWFRTGDIGKIVEKRFLKITDRKKDIFKTSSGKYVAPAPLESLLQSSPLIDQSMVIGYNRPYVTALILPNFDVLKASCKERNIHWTAPQFMAINPKVIQLIQKEIEQINKDLPNYQRIRNFHLLHEEWSIGTGELTPTMKVKRPLMIDKYKKEIELMYEGNIK